MRSVPNEVFVAAFCLLALLTSCADDAVPSARGFLQLTPEYGLDAGRVTMMLGDVDPDTAMLRRIGAGEFPCTEASMGDRGVAAFYVECPEIVDALSSDERFVTIIATTFTGEFLDSLIVRMSSDDASWTVNNLFFVVDNRPRF